MASAVSGMSKMAMRANASTSGLVASTTAASTARRTSGSSARARAKVSATIASAASAEGRRAASSFTPSRRNAAAINQKSSTGLSKYGR